MRKYAFMFFLLASISLLVHSQDLEKDWMILQNDNAVKVWKDRSTLKKYGVFQVSDRAHSLDWSTIKKEDFFKKIEEDKKKLLALVGIKKWSAQKYIWTKVGEAFELSIVGTYEDSSAKLIQFQELHIFQEKRTLQILYTQPYELIFNPNIGNKFIFDVRKSVGIK